MGLQLFTNNANSTMSGSLASAATTLTLFAGGGAKFPTPTAGDYFLLTLYEHDVSNNEENIEIVKCTARTSDTLTIVRNFESGAGVPAGGYAYPTAVGRTVYASLRWTAAGATNCVQGAIGVNVQAYDADTTKNDVANTFTATQTFNVPVVAKTDAGFSGATQKWLANASHGKATVNVRNSTNTTTLGEFSVSAEIFEFRTTSGGGFKWLGTNNIEAALWGQASTVDVELAVYDWGGRNLNLKLSPAGTGFVQFGTWASNADAAVNGYITIKDASGITRKLATIA